MVLNFSADLWVSFLGLLAYLGLTLVFSTIFIAFGSLFLTKLLEQTRLSIRLGVFGLSGITIFIFLSNICLHLFPAPLSLSISLALVVILALYRFYQFIHKKEYQKIKIDKSQLKIFSLSLGIIFLILFLGLFQRNNFDEEFHRPIIESLLIGNFPIRNPFNPAYFVQYNYHYGWEIASAAFSALFHLSAPVSLDLIKLIGTVLGFSLLWGVLPSKNNLIKASSALAFFLTGPFWFFRDSFTMQYLQGIKLEMVGFSFIHGVQAISFVSVYVFFAALYLVCLILTKKEWQIKESIYHIILLSFLGAGIALAGEFQLAALALIFGLIFLIKLICYFINRKNKIEISYWFIAIALVFSIAISVIQGGVLTGLVYPSKIIDNSVQPAGLDWVQTVKVDDKPILGIRKIKDFGFAPKDNYYISLLEPQRYASSLGVIGLIGFPLILVYFGYFVIKMIKKKELESYSFALALTAVIFFILPLVGTTRYGDMNFARAWTTANVICYSAIALIVFSFKTSSKIQKFLKGLFGLILVLSWLPAVVFNLGVFVFKPVFGNPSLSYILDRYSTSDRVLSSKMLADQALFTKIRANNYHAWTVTTIEDGQFFVEQTGNLTYRELFRAQSSFYDQIIQNLNPDDFKRIHAEYLYASPALLGKLTDQGNNNLRQYFTPVHTVTQDDVFEGVYKLNN